MKKFVNYSIFVLVATLLVFTSCEMEVVDSSMLDQDDIYTYYSLEYDSETDSTTISASFAEGNIDKNNEYSYDFPDAVELGGESTIGFKADNGMSYMAIPFVESENSHQITVQGFISGGTFEWIDNDGKKYINSASLSPVGFPDPATLDTIFGISTFKWEGNLIGENEFIGLTIEEGANYSQIYAAMQNEDLLLTRNIALATLPGDSLMYFANIIEPGEYEAFMMRVNVPGLTEKNSAGGQIVASYKVKGTVRVD